MAVSRSAFAKRGKLFTPKAVTIRCTRNDQSSVTVALHYLQDGNASLRFSLRKREFFIPVVLVFMALKNCTHREIFDHILGGGVCLSVSALLSSLSCTLAHPKLSLTRHMGLLLVCLLQMLATLTWQIGQS